METLKIQPSKLARKIFYIRRGEPLKFDTRPFWEYIYDANPKNEIVLFTGRQVGKSTFVSHSIGLHLLTGLDIGYVVPFEKQAKAFSHQKFKDNMSDKWHKLMGKPLVDNVLFKKWQNASLSMVAIAKNVESARGLTLDAVYFDEAQDLLLDDVLVVYETMSASKYSYVFYTGTAKTKSSLLWQVFEDSKRYEWVIKCECGKEWIIDDVKFLSPDGLKCPHCNRIMNPLNGRFVATNNAVRLGFRIPQVVSGDVNWTQIMRKWQLAKRQGQEALFVAEVLAVPIDISEDAFEAEELWKACSKELVTEEQLLKGEYNRPVVISVDWGYGIKSYTVVTVTTILNDIYWHIFMKRLPADMPMENQVRYIYNLSKKLNTVALCVDWGAGFSQNQWLSRHLTIPVYQIFWSNSIRIPIRRSDFMFVANRNVWLQQYQGFVKMGRVKFPHKDIFASLIDDFLAVKVELSKNGEVKYIHNVETPDDALHSACYGVLGWQLHNGEIDVPQTEVI